MTVAIIATAPLGEHTQTGVIRKHPLVFLFLQPPSPSAGLFMNHELPALTTYVLSIENGIRTHLDKSIIAQPPKKAERTRGPLISLPQVAGKYVHPT